MGAARYRFPDLSELPVSTPSAADFRPLVVFQSPVSSKAQDDGTADGWRPLFTPRPVLEPERTATPISSTQASPMPPAQPAPQVQRVERTVAPEPPIRTIVDQNELEQIRAAARKEAYDEAYARGLAEGKKALDAQAQRLEGALGALVTAREELFRRVRPDVVKLVSALTRKILRQTLQIDPKALASLVGSVLEELPRQERVVVRIAEADLATLEEALPTLRRRLGGYTQISLEPSEQASGVVIVEMEGGRVEASIDRQLDAFEMKAREWLLGEHEASSELVGAYGGSISTAEP